MPYGHQSSEAEHPRLEVDRKRKFYFRPKTETETESRYCHYNASLSGPTLPDTDVHVDSTASFLGYLYISISTQ